MIHPTPRIRTGHIHRSLSSIALAIFAALQSDGGTASDNTFIKTQPDGSTLELKQIGDEWTSWRETVDGYVVERDNDGYWKYATFEKGGIQSVPIRNAIVNKTSPETLGLKKRSRPTKESVQLHYEFLNTQNNAQINLPEPKDQRVQTLSLSTEDQIDYENQTRKCIVILAAFSDHWEAGNVVQAKGYSKKDYEAILGERGHSSLSPSGSVRDYYLENSYGKLDIEFHLSNWVRLPKPESWYGDNENEREGEQRVRDMAMDAITAAINDGFDFSVGDSNNDNWVDMLYIIHSGHKESNSGNPESTIWPRWWTIKEGRLEVEGISMRHFATSSAMNGSPDGPREITTIGTICHEIGHLLGLRDLYDVSDNVEGIGTWGLMGNGEWGALRYGNGSQPTHLSAFSKVFLGFVKPELVESGEQILPNVETNPSIHMIRYGLTNENEYFLLENRAPVGFDSELPPGILVWHVDETIPINKTDDHDHLSVYLEEASGEASLANSRLALPSHTWSEFSGLESGFQDVTGSAATNAMSYQNTHIFERSDNSDHYSGIRLSNFGPIGSTMRYNLQTKIGQLSSTSNDAGTVSFSWLPATGAEKYELQRAGISYSDSFEDGAEDYYRSHHNWHFAGNARRSSDGSSEGNYCFYLSTRDETNSNSLSRFQSMTLKKSFLLTESTILAYDLASSISSPHGALFVEASSDSGSSWYRINEHFGSIPEFESSTIGYEDFISGGIQSSQNILIRFRVAIQDSWGWSHFPTFGFAIDNIRIQNTRTEEPTEWESIASEINGLEFVHGERANGPRSYRIRSFANGQWQPYSTPRNEEINITQTDYYSWAYFIVKEENKDPSLDLDNDGYSNFSEYAFDSNPFKAGPPSFYISRPSNGSDHATVVFKRGQIRVRYVIEASTDLADWSNATEIWKSDDAVQLVSVGNEQFVNIPSLQGEDHAFIRLRMEQLK